MSPRIRGRRTVMVLGSAIVILLLMATMVVANHQFSDVPASSPFHSAIDWLSDRGITGGCGGGKYCPKNAVTRAQMALLLQREAGVIGPKVITQSGSQADIDLDVANVVCQTATHTPTFEQVAILDGRASIEPAIGPLEFFARAVYQTNGGAWTATDPAANGVSAGSNPSRDIFNSHSGSVNLTPGTDYKFGVRLFPWDGTSSGDATLEGDGTVGDPAVWCSLVAEVFNRNP